jgi:hypothetical protein
MPAATERLYLSSGQSIALAGSSSTERPWEAVEQHGVFTVERDHRGDSSRRDVYRGTGSVPIVLKTLRDAEALADALNKRAVPHRKAPGL